MLPLNLDCGEIEGDHILLKANKKQKISYCNVSCGGHSGTNKSITNAIKMALIEGVSIGAHPSYPDKANFGRMSMKLEEHALVNSIIDQLNFLQTILNTFGANFNHIKLHGALYNDAAHDEKIGLAFLQAVSSFNKKLKIFTLPNSRLYFLGINQGFEMIREGFGDRVYKSENILQSRSIEGALINDSIKINTQVTALNNGNITLENGSSIPLIVDTICLHGDNPSVEEFLI